MIKQCHFVRWRWRSYCSLFPRVVPVDNPSSIPAKSGPLICLPVDGGLLLFPISSVLVQPCINSVYLRRRLRVYICVCVRVCLRHCRYESMSIFGSVTEKIWSIVGLSMVCVQVMMRLLKICPTLDSGIWRHPLSQKIRKVWYSWFRFPILLKFGLIYCIAHSFRKQLKANWILAFS